MKKNYTLFSIVVLLIFSFASFAQTVTEKENAGYRKVNAEARAVGFNAQKKIKAPVRMMKDADFTLYSFPGKGTNYISVKDALPNTPVKVVAYDVTGKLIFMKQLTSNPYGQLIVNIDPMISFTPGTSFVAAIYNNQAFYETMYLNK